MKLLTAMRKLGGFKKVRNMKSFNSRREVPNQFILKFENGEVFQSYESIIAVKFNDGAVFLGEHWNYSRTTQKYRNEFLRENTAETRNKLEIGKYGELDHEED